MKLDLSQFPEGYEITADGRVFSVASNWRGYGRRELRQNVHNDGYMTVSIVANGKRKRFRIHQLVALAFVGPSPSPEHEVRHLDGNPHNNAATNLAWGTRAENAADRARHGRTVQGTRQIAAKLTPDDVRAIRASTETTRALGRQYGVDQSVISEVKRRVAWKSV